MTKQPGMRTNKDQRNVSEGVVSRAYARPGRDAGGKGTSLTSVVRFGQMRGNATT